MRRLENLPVFDKELPIFDIHWDLTLNRLNKEINMNTNQNNTANVIDIGHSSDSFLPEQMTNMSWLSKLTSETAWKIDKKKGLM